jgi:hypothetical protein
MSKAKQPKPQEQVWIVHINYIHLALPDHASAKALIAALTKATIVDRDYKTDQYFREDRSSRQIAFEVIDAERLHLDREKPVEPADPPPPRVSPRLNGARQLMLEGKVTP